MNKTVIMLSVIFILITVSPVSASDEYVVLLHGIGKSKRAMSKIEKVLGKNGFIVSNIDYPSTSKKLEPLSLETIAPVIKEINRKKPSKIHFVTHSMGGILLRAYLSQKKIENIGHIVMLSPPNKGSEVVDAFGGLFLFRWIYGPSGLQLGTENREFFKKIKPEKVTIGVITGDRTWNPILSGIIPGPDDGKVSIESAKIEGMKDFLVLHENHTFIVRDNRAIQETITFLKTGKFSESSM